ncbi:MAG: TrmH family RNA methyltransferase [Spirochaetes bacterium]|nr:TrmH family RNA methyltransferase [Spirochaetota bacterium]
MFPLQKLAELSPKTRQRKIARLIQSLEVDLGRSLPIDTAYAQGLLALLAGDPPAGSSARAAALAISRGSDPALILRELNAVRHELLRALQAEPAEWDLLVPETGSLDRSASRVFPVAVYLEDIRSPFNVGSIFRTSEAFGVQRILLSPRTPLPSHPRAGRTARGADAVVAWEVAELSALEAREGVFAPEGVFALELGGSPIGEFAFPARGIVLVGSEELGLSPEALRLADRSLGRVSIPQAGAKRSLNVAVAFGILMQKWFSVLDAGPSEG